MRIPLAPAVAVLLSAPLAIAQAFPCFETSLGVNLALGDDQVAPGLLLGFTFPGPGGVSVTSIDVSSNGFVWLASNPNPRCCSGESSKLLSQAPSIAPFWVDLDPAAAGPGGGVFFNAFPASGSIPARAVITWAQVPEFGGQTLFTFQLQMNASGAMFFYYDPSVANNQRQVLVGVSEGSANPTGVAVGNAVDISVATPPINTGTNPTFFEEMWGFDAANRTFEITPNGIGGYTIADPANCQPASWTQYGGGCPHEPVFYEHFVSPSTIDLSNTAMLVSPNGLGGWVVTPSTGFYTPTSAPIATGDDVVTGPFPLPWPWAWSGGVTSAIDVSSNGFIWLNSGNSNSRCCSGDPAALLFDPASICGHWMDLNPNVGGSIHVDTDPLTSDVHITWLGVPEYGTTIAQTFQISLFANGSFQLSYQGVSSTLHDSLTGISGGGTPSDPGSIDLSVAIPFDTGPGGIALRLDAANGARPQIGTTFVLELSSVSPGSMLGLMVFGLNQVLPGLDLTSLGMPGCLQYVSLDIAVAFPLLPLPQLNFPLPNNTAMVGVQFFVQGATVTPSANPLGIAVSNGGVMTLGI